MDLLLLQPTRRNVTMASKPQLAFIRRYSCLYTRDLHKKAKAWQDGYLVFHHLNAKMVLLSDNFVILDECFFRAPGLNTMRDVPKSYRIPTDTSVSFDKFLATLDEAVFEEEKDISEIFEKKRKQVTDLDDFVDSDEDHPIHPAKKRNSTVASSALRQAPDSRPAQSGWLYRIGSASSSSAAAATSAGTASPAPSIRQNPRHSSVPSTPLRQQAAISNKSKVSNFTPKTTTPFKPPSFVTNGPASSPAPSRPMSVARRTLGSTRPSSLLARQSLQAEWAKYADQLPTCASKAKPSTTSTLRYGESIAEREQRKAAHLEKLKSIPEPEIVSVDQKRRDGEPGDPCSWLFES